MLHKYHNNAGVATLMINIRWEWCKKCVLCTLSKVIPSNSARIFSICCQFVFSLLISHFCLTSCAAIICGVFIHIRERPFLRGEEEDIWQEIETESDFVIFCDAFIHVCVGRF